MNNIRALRDLLVSIEEELELTASADENVLAKLHELRQQCALKLELLEQKKFPRSPGKYE